MKKFFTTLFLIAISLVIVIPRFTALGTTPPGLHIDEVSFAADAKAIAETGRDTWDTPWPTAFKAYGEWKAPGLTYAMAFWSKILGRMDLTIARLPSALAGLTILVVFGATLRLLIPQAPLAYVGIAVLIMAFSPWHFDMSRIFYEAFSALSFFALGFYAVARILLKKGNWRWWLVAVLAFALTGYFYASMRYVVIGTLAVALYLGRASFAKHRRRAALTVMLVFLVASAGWLGDLFSSRGLNRLYYYQNKTTVGTGLEIDDKKQYCYLSFVHLPLGGKVCPLLWNRPLTKIMHAARTAGIYIGTDYLFVKAESEYGFDSEYGAYLFPLLPFYLIGLGYLGAQALTKKSRLGTVAQFFGAVLVLSLVPAALANNINMRMAMIALYLVGIVLALGIYSAWAWLYLMPHGRLLGHATMLCMFLVWSYYTVQSVAHYYLVFVHSNDAMWTSDASTIFTEVKARSKNYDRIIDTALHGPLAPYFYGDLTTTEIQAGTFSAPDAFGFSYLVRAGKYELIHQPILDLACTKVGTHDTRKTLVITDPPDHNIGDPLYEAKTWNKVSPMRQLYDLDMVVAYQLDHNPSFKGTCVPK
jgi:4-amino-4-deoxy-L-arabinose transferase-like glycosyltransferase